MSRKLSAFKITGFSALQLDEPDRYRVQLASAGRLFGFSALPPFEYKPIAIGFRVQVQGSHYYEVFFSNWNNLSSKVPTIRSDGNPQVPRKLSGGPTERMEGI